MRLRSISPLFFNQILIRYQQSLIVIFFMLFLNQHSFCNVVGDQHHPNSNISYISTKIETNAIRFTIDCSLANVQSNNELKFFLALPSGEIESSELYDFQTEENGVVTDHDRSETVKVEHREEGFIQGVRVVSFKILKNLDRSVRIKKTTIRVKYKKMNFSEGNPTLNTITTLASELVLNSNDVKKFLNPIQPNKDTAANIEPVDGNNSLTYFNIPINKNGLYKFSGKDLREAGLNTAEIRPSDITLSVKGLQSDLWANDKTGTTIKDDDLFAFYGKENDSTYTVTNVYRISTHTKNKPEKEISNSAEAVSVTSPFFWSPYVNDVDTSPVLTKHDKYMTILDHRWVRGTWSDRMRSSIPGAMNYEQGIKFDFDLPGLYSNINDLIECDLSFFVNRLVEKHSFLKLSVQLNGGIPEEINIDSDSDENKTVSFSANQFREKSNVMEVRVVEQSGNPEVAFDKLSLYYPRSYIVDNARLSFTSPINYTALKHKESLKVSGNFRYSIEVSNDEKEYILFDSTSDDTKIIPFEKDNNKIIFHFNEQRFTEYTLEPLSSASPVTIEKFVSGANLLTDVAKASFIAISYPDFIEDLKPWLDLKNRQGRTVRIVNVDDVYNQFDFGQKTPIAVKRFLAHTLQQQQSNPNGNNQLHSVLLVGDATSDYRNDYRENIINYIPSMTFGKGEQRHASDQWYARLSGNDKLSDIAIGRFSVNNREDLQNIIAKQIHYNDVGTSHPWNSTIGIISDHSGFEHASEKSVARDFQYGYFIKSLFLSDLPWIDNYYFPIELAAAKKAKISPVATEGIRNIFQDGVGLLTYFGHGSPNIWSNERIWFGGGSPNSDNLLLSNYDRLPFVVNMTCNTGTFDYPRTPWNICISEDLLRVRNAGAIGCYVPASQGITSQHELFMAKISNTLLNNPRIGVGSALLQANWEYLLNGNPSELPDMYNLLGDPGLRLNLLKASGSKNLALEKNEDELIFKLPDDVKGKNGRLQFISGESRERFHKEILFNKEQSKIHIPISKNENMGSLKVQTDDQSSFHSYNINPQLNIKLISWEMKLNPNNKNQAIFELLLKNNNDVEIQDLCYFFNAYKGEQKSELTTFAPHEEKKIIIKVSLSENFNEFQFFVLYQGISHRIDSNGSFFTPSGGITVPALIPKNKVVVRYHTFNSSINATINFRIFNISNENLAGIRAEYVSAGNSGDEVVLATAQIPSLAAGTNIPLSFVVKFPVNVTDIKGYIRLAGGSHPEKWNHKFDVDYDLNVNAFPDVEIVQPEIQISNLSPMDGETVFFTIPVKNIGKTVAASVELKSYFNTTSGPVELESQLRERAAIKEIEPGDTVKFKVRWDPVNNAGTNILNFRSFMPESFPELTKENNSTTISLQVRTKSRLKIQEMTMAKRTEEDLRLNQVRVIARIANIGESSAQGIVIRFYSDRAKTAEQFLGDISIPKIGPEEIKEIEFIYKLKPTDVNRVFNFTCETTLKGSLQRIPLQ